MIYLFVHIYLPSKGIELIMIGHTQVNILSIHYKFNIVIKITTQYLYLCTFSLITVESLEVTRRNKLNNIMKTFVGINFFVFTYSWFNKYTC